MYYYILDNNKNIPIGELLTGEEVYETILGRKFGENAGINIDSILKQNKVKYISFRTKSEYKKHLIEYLLKTATEDVYINFNNLKGKITNKNLETINKIQKVNNYGVAYLNRIVNMQKREIYFGIMVHINGLIVSSKYTSPYTKSLDEVPFLLLRNVLKYLKSINRKYFINEIILGYNYEINPSQVNINDKKLITDLNTSLSLPNSNNYNRERMKILNMYLTQNIKILPMVEI